MDFIERIFGIAPDAGSGAFEIFLVAVPVLIFGLLVRTYRLWRRASCASGAH